MTKRQRTMTNMLVRVRNPKESMLEIEHVDISPCQGHENDQQDIKN